MDTREYQILRLRLGEAALLKNQMLNKADAWWLKKQKPVHTPGSPVFFSLPWQAEQYWKVQEAQEQRLPFAYALALACVFVLIGNGVNYSAHAYS